MLMPFWNTRPNRSAIFRNTSGCAVRVENPAARPSVSGQLMAMIPFSPIVTVPKLCAVAIRDATPTYNRVRERWLTSEAGNGATACVCFGALLK